MSQTGGAISLPWAEGRHGMVARSGGAAGSGWVDYPPVRGDTIHGFVAMVPAGHATPERQAGADLALLGVRGGLDVAVGGRVHRLGPLDLLLMPPDSRFALANHGAEPAVAHFTYGCGAPDFAGAVRYEPAGEVRHHDWAAYRADFKWTLPLSDQWGFRRGSGPYFGYGGLRGHTVRMPPGQTTPWHYAPRELLFMPVSGTVEFHCGGTRHDLGPLDQLIIPARMPYRYANSGFDEVFFLSMGGRLPEGAKGRYFAEDPGWPVRADARVMETAVDPYGNAAVTRG